MTRDFIIGLLLGVAIAIVWRNLNAPTPTPPRGAKAIKVNDTKDMAEYRERLGRVG